MPQDPKDLYKRILMRHSKEPRNRRTIEGSSSEAFLANALCGDEVTMYLKIDNDQLSDVSFNAQCCSICMASASMLTEKAKGSSQESTEKLVRQFLKEMREEEDDFLFDESEDLYALKSVKAFPSRLRCATLPWEALKEALSAVDQK